jgi:hypothetical protein
MALGGAKFDFHRLFLGVFGGRRWESVAPLQWLQVSKREQLRCRVLSLAWIGGNLLDLGEGGIGFCHAACPAQSLREEQDIYVVGSDFHRVHKLSNRCGGLPLAQRQDT